MQMETARAQKRPYTCKRCGQPKKGHTCSETDNVPNTKIQKAVVVDVKNITPLKWEFEDGSVWDVVTKTYTPSHTWIAYGDSYQGKLSIASLANTSDIRIHVGTPQSEYIVDFVHMVQVRIDNGFTRRIRSTPGTERSPVTVVHQPVAPPPIDMSKTPFLNAQSMAKYYPAVDNPQLSTFPGTYTDPPSYWMGDDMVTLTPETEIFKEVAHLFGQGIGGTRYFLSSIDMNCCSARFRQYIAMKESMKSPNEMWAWHGTDAKTVKLICSNGYLRDFSKIQAYGAGCYFAKQSGLSFDGYSKVSKTNNIETKVLLLSRILVGVSCVGDSTKKHTPLQSDGTLYNSMVDSLRNPSIFVLGDGSDNQAFPEFVLYFTRTPTTKTSA